jgi:hypothetical protein
MPINPLLTNRTVVLAKLESSYNDDPVPAFATDGILVEAPDYQVDPSVLERNFARNDLSRLPHRIGRKLARMTFTTELRGNGTQNSGLEANAPVIGRLFRACGYTELGLNSAAENINGPVWVSGSSASAAGTFTKGGAPTTNQGKRRYKITTVLAGASATAKVRVTTTDQDLDSSVLGDETFTATVLTGSGTLTWSATDPLAPTLTVGGTWAVGDTARIVCAGIEFEYTSASTVLNTVADEIAALLDAHPLIVAPNPAAAVIAVTFTGTGNGVTLTSGTTAISLGDSGLSVTLTWAGSLVLGDNWYADSYPLCIRYKPRSTGFESLTLYMYMDGTLHRMTGAYGTFTSSWEAGSYPKISWTFTGQYIAPIDAALPAPTFETAQPNQIELARMKIDDLPACIQSFTFDQGNNIVPRICANASDGYDGVRLVARSVSGGIDPEATLVLDNDFWSDMASAKQMRFRMRAGATPGNIVWVWAPAVQYTGLTYQDRDSLRVYDAGIAFSREVTDDEVEWLFA